MDALSNSYLKTWAELPHCATQDIINSENAQGILNINDLYHLCHYLELANVRLVADRVVNVAMDLAIRREMSSQKDQTNTEKTA
jgi:hypothetical protein